MFKNNFYFTNNSSKGTLFVIPLRIDKHTVFITSIMAGFNSLNISCELAVINLSISAPVISINSINYSENLNEINKINSS